MVGGDEGDGSSRGDRPGIEVGRLRLGEMYTVYPFVVHGSGGEEKGLLFLDLLEIYVFPLGLVEDLFPPFTARRGRLL